MKIALTCFNQKNRENSTNLGFFKPECLDEQNHPLQACSSELMNPAKVLKNLGLAQNYLQETPFCYIRSYAPIWEYYLVALFLKDDKKKIKQNYKYMRTRPSKAGRQRLGKSFQRVGNLEYETWEKNYTRLDQFNLSGSEKERIKELKNESRKFVKELIKRKCSIRECSLEDAKHPQTGFIKFRKKAASAFLSFLIHGKKLNTKDIKELVAAPEKHLWLLKHFENSKQQETYQHILSTSLLMCLYGYKGGVVSKNFCKKVKKCISKENVKNEELKKHVIKLLTSAIEKKDGSHVESPLKKIYQNRDRINIQQRLGTWMQLLKGVSNAQKEP